MLKRVAGNLYRRLLPRRFTSYAQCGEDLILNYLLRETLGIEKPTYLDIGAHHPVFLSNTYFFYVRGCFGVCVEPDISLFQRIRRVRKRDKCLNVAISDKSEWLDFYIIDPPTLNTFSEKEAKLIEASGTGKITKIRRVEVRPVNEIIEENFERSPNAISLDVEGLDMAILKSLDFSRFRPAALCVETVNFNTWEKDAELISFMEAQGYSLYSDTFINSIFVERELWEQRKRRANSSYSGQTV